MIIASGGVEDRPRTPEEKGKNPAAAANIVLRFRGSNHIDASIDLVLRSALLRASRRTATSETAPAAMLRDASQRARIERLERDEWRCAAPQYEGRGFKLHPPNRWRKIERRSNPTAAFAHRSHDRAARTLPRVHDLASRGTLDGDAPRNLDAARPWRVNRTET